MNTDSQYQTAAPQSVKPRPALWKVILKILAWGVMAVLLFIVGIIMGTIYILTPERLTPLTERIATQSLQNAEVRISKVELTVVSTFPYVHARIDSLKVLSTVRSLLDADLKAALPEYTDTVLTVRGFKGGLNVVSLLSNQLDLADVIIDHPSANLVVIDEQTTNFDIIPVKDEEEKPFNWEEIPGISLKRFAITNPGKLRFYNHDSQTEINASLKQVELDGSKAPLYTIEFDGSVRTPSELFSFVNIPDLKFGLNGSMTWSQKRPTLLALDGFDFLFSIVGGRINTEIDFSHGLKVNRLDVAFEPLDVAEVLRMVPARLAGELGIPTAEEVRTDARLDLSLRLKKEWNVASDTLAPFVLTADIPSCYFRGYGLSTDNASLRAKIELNRPWSMSTSLPDVDFDLNIAPMSLRWNDLVLNNFSLNLGAQLPFGDLDRAKVDIRSLDLAGPATSLSVKGILTKIVSDPYFDGTVDGKLDISKLPKKIMDRIDGSVAGLITTHIGLKGSPSMFNTENFHRLGLTGDLTLQNLYFLSGDTVNMVNLHRADVHFGTSEKIVHRGDTKADSLLRVSLKVDTGLIIHGDLVMNLSQFKIGLAAQNTSERLDRGRINPMGGNLSLKSFNLLKTNDSAVVRLRDVNGYTLIKAYNNDIRTPQFIFDLNAGRISTGDKETRLLINNAHSHIDVRRVAKGRSAQQFSKIADSVHYVHPHLPPDSVMKIALEIHNRHRSKYPRVHEKWVEADGADIIDWGASPLFKRLLTLWTFDGTLTSSRAGLFTPHFPLRNRLRHIDVSFNNDSVVINNLQYKIGHSDFTINGVLSNMRRAFTQNTNRQPLRINFDMVSDTIDINQLTETIMAGAAYSAMAEKRHLDLNAIEEDEESLEERIARLTQDAPDTVMPILIPENIDAQFTMRSKNVEYSDFRLNQMRGRVLAYGGALNLQDLSATSDVGSIGISALYTGLHPDSLRFGFGLKLHDFNLHRFLHLVPAIDSLMPVMRDFSGIISAEIAATSDVDRNMNLVLPSLDAAVGIQGDSLVLLDPDTFHSLSKWLLFKDKNRNIIDHMNVQMIIKNNQVDVYPFIFDFDRYKLGVQGYNDFDMNFAYHIAVLKSPIPFKFGINISGNPDKLKVRLGGAKFGEKQIRQVAIVDTTRINLMREINNVFKRGARNARLARLQLDSQSPAAGIDLNADTLTHADSLRYIQEGLIEAPAPVKNKVKGRKNKKVVTVSEQTDIQSGMGVLVVLLSMTLYKLRSRYRRKRNRDDQNDSVKTIKNEAR